MNIYTHGAQEHGCHITNVSNNVMAARLTLQNNFFNTENTDSI